MPGKLVKDYLDFNGIQYVSLTHSPAYTAQAIAESSHISGKKVAKTIIVKIDDTFAMTVLTANTKLSTYLLQDLLNAEKVEFASEAEFKDKFPDCEIGAMPPFGNLYNMNVYVSKEINADDEIAFNAGSHTELIQLKYKDFKHLVKPKVLDISLKG